MNPMHLKSTNRSAAVLMMKSSVLAGGLLLATAATSRAAVFVDFSGGAGSTVQITLPAMSFIVNNANALNFDNAIGIAIALGAEPATVFYTNASAAGSAGLFSSSNSATTFAGAPGYYFYSNTVEPSGLYSGGVVWYGESFSANAVNGDVFTFNGGTISTTKAIAESFADGNYEVYVLAGLSGAVSTTAGVATAVPEPSAAALLAITAATGFLTRRRRRA
jgi:hypothetical protein